MKPLLRWAGSKRKILGELEPYWQTAAPERYIEAFAGSAALFFELAPKRAVINDANENLIHFYRGIKKYTALVYELASAMQVNEATYYGTRKKYVLERDPIKRAAYFYYLNRYCFNGIYRTNSDGIFNVPFAKDRTGNFPQWDEVDASVKQLRKATTTNKDFESLIDLEVEKGDFVYLDPPYAVENQRIFTQYNATTFGLDDLTRLSETLDEIDRRGATFVLSYARCDEAIKCFSKWHRRQIVCHRSIAGFAKHRQKAEELIFSNIDLRKKK